MIKPKKSKSSMLSRGPLISAETRLTQLRAARVRAVNGADERAQWVQRSAQVLKGIVQRAATDGVFIGGVLVGPVRHDGKKPVGAKIPSRSKALVLRKRPK